MFDIRRFNNYIFSENEDNLIMEFSGKSAQLNSFYHLEIYYTNNFVSDQNSWCVYIPNNNNPDWCWKLNITFLDEINDDEDAINDFNERIFHILEYDEPVINTDFNWREYEIPSYVWFTITGIIITII